MKDAQSDELKKETRTLDVKLPPECATSKASISTWQKGLTVSYTEPKMQELGYTTIYLTAPGSQAQAIRVWTNDARGGANVVVRNIAAPAQDFAVCVTATSWGGKESPPALLKSLAR